MPSAYHIRPYLSKECVIESLGTQMGESGSCNNDGTLPWSQFVSEEPGKCSHYIHYFTPGTILLLTIVNISWLLVKMFHAWKNCLLCLPLFPNPLFLNLDDMASFVSCLPFLAFVMLVPFPGLPADHLLCEACPSSPRLISPRINLTYCLYTPLLQRLEAWTIVWLVYRLIFHAKLEV